MFNGFVLYGGTGRSKSPDFLLELGDRVIPIEVGKGKKDTSQLKLVEKRAYGILLTDSLENYQLEERDIAVPLKWFLLM